jgi:hypothetical protein
MISAAAMTVASPRSCAEALAAIHGPCSAGIMFDRDGLVCAQMGPGLGAEIEKRFSALHLELADALGCTLMLR